MKRYFVGAIAAIVALGASVAGAQEYPTKAIRFMVPFPPGTATDALARAIGPKLNEMWGQPVLVENRPGAGSVVGTQVVSNAPADGYMLLMVSASHAINATLHAPKSRSSARSSGNPERRPSNPSTGSAQVA